MSDDAAMPLLESVPNVSCGRDAARVRRLADAARDGGAWVADVHTDVDHDRSVLTMFGTAGQLTASLRSLAAACVAELSVEQIRGVHPITGVLDVVPIVPLSSVVDGGGTVEDARAVADGLALLLAEDHDLPVLRYGIGADDALPHTGGARALVRDGGGPAEHPTAGVTLLGVREVMIAFNVELDTGDVSIATAIASVIRERGGGLAGVRALGLEIASRGTVQVSCNLDRWRDCGPAEVLERVLDLAAIADTDVVRAELVGLAPREAVHDLGIAARRNRTQVWSCTEPSLEVRARLARERLART